MAESDNVKVGVWFGDGPPPGYEYTVLMLSNAHDEMKAVLTEGQMWHVRKQIQELARHKDPTHSDTLSIDKVENFYELRDKGGWLGSKTNVRVYFDISGKGPYRCIRILGFSLKKNEGQMSMPKKENVKRRKRDWDAGAYPAIKEILAWHPTREEVLGKRKDVL